MAIKVSLDSAEALSLIDAAPEKFMQCVLKSSRRAASKSAKQMRGSIEPRFQKLVKYKVSKTDDHNTSVAVGLFKGKGQKSGNQPKSGAEIDDWFKIYWKNYGTLSRRDPSHRFTRSRKAKTRDWKGGISPRNQFESAEGPARSTFEREFEAEMEKNFDKTFNK